MKDDYQRRLSTLCRGSHPGIEMKPQVIVCGLGRTGYRIFQVLQEQGTEVVGISQPSMGSGAIGSGAIGSSLDRAHKAESPHNVVTHNVIVGDLRSEQTLLRAGIRQANTLLLATADDAVNLAVLTQARLLNPRIRIVNRLFNTRLGEHLDHSLPNHISMSLSALVAPIFAFAVTGKSTAGQLSLFHKAWPITTLEITPGHPWQGKTLAQLWENRHRMLIAYESAEDSLDLMSAIAKNQPLGPGDRLILAEFPQAKHPKKSWRRRLNRLWRGLRQLQQSSRSALQVFVALLGTIGIALVTYTVHDPTISVVDALYFSVGMITGAGGQESVAENAPAAIKVFTAAMMLVGAGVIGVCYALLNDFVLGTHLQGIWTSARIPQGGHCIVCGLGGVGYRVVDQLLGLGEEVVALEHNAQGRFLRAARNQKIPVIVGDATVAEILQIANVTQAAALLAVTSDDTINLEIAISARSLAPGLPVLVRIHDPKFAQQIQQVFEFDRVMSPIELTAPAFAAAAIGGRIFGHCLTRSGLWLAISTLVTQHHPFHGRSLQEAAATEQFTPLYAEVEGKAVQGQALLELCLANGTVLHLMMPAPRWEKLWAHHSLQATFPF